MKYILASVLILLTGVAIGIAIYRQKIKENLCDFAAKRCMMPLEEHFGGGGGRGGGGGGRGGGGRGGGGRGGGGRGGGGRGGGGWGGRGGWGHHGGWRGRGWGRNWGGGWGWPTWWYDPAYYVDLPYEVDDSNGCDNDCLDDYKAAMDSAGPNEDKKRAAKAKLVDCLAKCKAAGY